MSKYTYKIEHDQGALNPRDEWDNLSTFYSVKNSRYITGGKKDVKYAYREDLEDVIKALRKEGAIIEEFSHNCGTQYAVVEKSQLKHEYLDFGQTMRQARKHARNCAKGDISVWKARAEGEVYGYIVEDENGEHVDSCWGFYGDDGRKEAEREAKDIIEWREKQDYEKGMDNLPVLAGE